MTFFTSLLFAINLSSFCPYQLKGWCFTFSHIFLYFTTSLVSHLRGGDICKIFQNPNNYLLTLTLLQSAFRPIPNFYVESNNSFSSGRCKNLNHKYTCTPLLFGRAFINHKRGQIISKSFCRVSLVLPEVPVFM